MSLNLTGAAPAAIVALAPEWAPKLRAYALLRERQQEADAEARAAKTAVDASKSEILTALMGAKAATCAGLIVTVKEGKPVAPSLTLATGQKLPWEKVTSLLVGNAVVPAAEVSTLYGGRSASTTIEVAGT